VASSNKEAKPTFYKPVTVAFTITLFFYRLSSNVPSSSSIKMAELSKNGSKPALTNELFPLLTHHEEWKKLDFDWR
jgi:hypothetical protein